MWRRPEKNPGEGFEMTKDAAACERIVSAQTIVIEELVQAVFGVWVTSGVVPAAKAEATLEFLADRIEKTDYELGFRKDGPDPDMMRDYARRFRLAATDLGQIAQRRPATEAPANGEATAAASDRDAGWRPHPIRALAEGDAATADAGHPFASFAPRRAARRSA